MSIVYNDVVTMDDGTGKYEFKLFFQNQEDSEIMTSLLIGTFARCKKYSIEHFVFMNRNYMQVMNRKKYVQANCKRAGLEQASPHIKYASEYTLREYKTKKEVKWLFTYTSLSHMTIVNLLLPSSLRDQFVGVRHFRRINDDRTWKETTIIPPVVGYPPKGMGNPEG